MSGEEPEPAEPEDGSPPAQAEPTPAAQPEEPAPEREESDPVALEFRGTALGVMPLHLFRLLVLGGLCVTLPFGLGVTVVAQVRDLFAPLGSRNPWPAMEAAFGTLPLVSSGVVAVMLLYLLATVQGWIWRYRLRHTWVHGEPIDYRSGCNPIAGWFSFTLALGTGGLATPWIFTWARRRLYRRCHTKHGPLGFAGSGLGIAWYGALSLLCLPFTFVTLGLAWVIPRYLWLAWEQDNLLVPDEHGNPCETEWEGSLLGFGAFVVLRWLLTLVTLGLLHPWAMTATWRWAADRTRFTPRGSAQ